jgi:L-2-hydroxyglutarate oxidase LhgO
MHEVDYLIVGAGVNGLFLARELKGKYPDARIAVLDKETDVAKHASGNCSGNLHAGFFFTSDKFKINLECNLWTLIHTMTKSKIELIQMHAFKESIK